MPTEDMAKFMASDDGPDISTPPSALQSPVTNAPASTTVSQPSVLPGGASLLPLSQNQLASMQQQQIAARAVRALPSPATQSDYGTSIGAQPGVPFDATSGIPMINRLRMELARTKESQLNVLRNIYGPDKVRMNPRGDPVITTVNPATGKEEDVLADPYGADAGDLMKLAANAPEILAGALVTHGVPVMPGILGTLRALGVMAAASEGAGAAKDVVQRYFEKEPIQLGEIGKSRTEMAGSDLLMGTALAGLGKAVTKVISPFNTKPELNIDASQARQDLIKRFGLSQSALPQTPAEITGNTMLGRIEARESKLPGSQGIFSAQKKQVRDELEQIQRVMEGNTPTVGDEALGQKALERIGATTLPLESDIQQAAKSLKQTATSEIESGIAAATGVSGPVDQSALGGAIRSEAMAKRAVFKAQDDSNYNELYSHPLVQDKNIDATPLAKDAAALRNRLPTREDTVTSDTGLVNQYGAPITISETKSTPLKEFIPDNVLSKLNSLTGLKGQEMRLDELIAMRREVRNDIALGESIPGAQTHYLGEIKDMLTSRIEKGLDELGDPEVKALWRKANDFHAQNVGQFNKNGIAQIFKDPEQAGYLGDSALVQRALSGKGADDIYDAYSSFFGSNSPHMAGLRRSVADEVLGTNRLNDTVDASGFLKRLEGLFGDAPKLAEDVFGPQAKQLQASGLALKGVGNTLSADELEKAIAQGQLSYSKLQDLMAAGAKRDFAYRNKIVKAAAKGALDTERIVPSEFVDRFAFKSEPADIRDVLGKIAKTDPQLVEDIQQSTRYKVFEAARDAKGELTSSGIYKLLNDSTMHDRLGSILQPDDMAALRELARFLAPSERLYAQFSASGSWGATSRLGALIEHGPLKYLDAFAKSALEATLYTSRGMKAWASNQALSPRDAAQVVHSLIASEPFIKLIQQYKGNQALNEAKSIKDGVDAWTFNMASKSRSQQNPPAAQSPGQSPNKIIDMRAFLNSP